MRGRQGNRPTPAWLECWSPPNRTPTMPTLRTAQAPPRFPVLLGLTLAVLVTPATGQGTPESTPSESPRGTRPNIVLILADDLGYGDPGCYNDDSKIPTPAIDRLAAEGTRYTDAHSPSSVCSPTRYGILTGRYAWRTALKRSVLWPWDPPLLEDERTTLPEWLQGQGYATACIGKWHLGWNWPLDRDQRVRDVFDGLTLGSRKNEIQGRIDFGRSITGGPLAHGFDHYFGDDVPNFPPYTFIEDDRVTVMPTVAKPEGMFGHPGPAAPAWVLSMVLPTLAQRATAWIDQRGEVADEPFFLYLPLTTPHTPIAPAAEFIGSSAAGPYGDLVHGTDWLVGQVMEALERNGLGDDTLVIFTSDNGSPQRDGTGMTGPVGSVKERFDHDASRPWRGLKSDAWEGGHRVPFILRWPGRIAAARECDAPQVHTDLYRTIASLVGGEPPKGEGEDSFDQLGHWTGTPDAPPRDHLVHHSGNGLFAIRVGPWKLIQGKGSGGFTRYTPPEDAPKGQLYNLDLDPEESNNLYLAEPEVVERLAARLEVFRSSGRSVLAD